MNTREQLTATIEQLRQAMINADGTTLTALSSEHLTYGHSNGNIQNQQQFVDTIVSGKSVFVSIQLSGEYIDMNGDTAIVRNTFTAATNDGGVPNSIRLHILWVWVLQGNGWKMLARQAVRLAQ